jgi:3-methylcrotonyl-CoA carboxylase alpha subunit
MFDKILIANRGEIACRILRTAKRLGIRTVAVYSEADAGALHVSQADEAVRIGPAPAGESYLCADKILDAARRRGVEAIHPGYGFLAENAGFARACSEAGVIFIGPPVAAIEAMGSKSAAKRIMEETGVPLLPGYHGEDQSLKRLQLEAEQIGYPLLIKPSAGGGGKGMRVVAAEAELESCLAAARREAASAFGDDRVLLERYLTRPRHVEVQVFADSRGQVVHLFERDCSIQRRHQKVIEEAPAPGMGPDLRRRMGEVAVAAARSIGYVGAGTIEFLLDEDGAFFFMEMNTRLQVEHPVTEMITGQDLVEWQLRVAAGEPLPFSQEELSFTGHAIEARLYAEDPDRDFLPSIGRLHHFRAPEESPDVRIDTGVRQGDEVTVYYDPMIAKLIVRGCDRDEALRRLRGALCACQVVGVTSNAGFLGAVAAHPDFAAGEVDTGFIEHHRGDLFPEGRAASDQTLALACLDVLLRRKLEAREGARNSFDPWSPWHLSEGWRLNSDNHHVLTFRDEERDVSVVAHYRRDGYLLELPGKALLVSGEIDASGDLFADLGGTRLRATVVRHGPELTVFHQGASHRLVLQDPSAQTVDQETAGGLLTAPMPGKIVAVMVESGARVKKGAPLMILEAMKMEHTITAPADGTVTDLNFPIGALVSEGAELVGFEAGEGG